MSVSTRALVAPTLLLLPAGYDVFISFVAATATSMLENRTKRLQGIYSKAYLTSS
jgi:hypothetical protein